MKKTIGNKDVLDFPDLKLMNVPAKVDTGAKTSAIHSRDVSIQNINGKEVLTCRLLDKEKVYEFEDFDSRTVKNSFGHSEKRYVIRLKPVIFGETIETEFTLSNREEMNFPVLLGRRFLNKRFVVDVEYSNLSLKEKENGM